MRIVEIIPLQPRPDRRNRMPRSGCAKRRRAAADRQQLASVPLSWSRLRPNHHAPLISIIDPRTLGRDTLTRALQAVDGTFRIRAYAGVEEWLQGEDIEHETSAILLGIGAAGADDPDVVDQLQRLARTYAHIPTVVMGDIEDPLHIVKVLGYGARGYIPTSVNLNVVVGAISLARAGGLFVPASSLTAFQPTNEAAVTSPLRSPVSSAGGGRRCYQPRQAE